MRASTKIVLFLIVMLVLMGCAPQQVLIVETPKTSTTVKFPVLNEPLFGAPMAVPDLEKLFHLSQQQQQRFHEYINDPVREDIRYHEKTFNYLEKILDRFEHHNETMPASQTLTLKKGNCMSLAILTTALARQAGVELRYRLVQDMPIYDIKDSLLVTSEHVQTVLYHKIYTKEKKRSHSGILP